MVYVKFYDTHWHVMPTSFGTVDAAARDGYELALSHASDVVGGTGDIYVEVWQDVECVGYFDTYGNFVYCGR